MQEEQAGHHLLPVKNAIRQVRPTSPMARLVFFVGFIFTFPLLSGCLTYSVRKSIPDLSENAASYAAQTTYFSGVVFYQLYSVLPGKQRLSCKKWKETKQTIDNIYIIKIAACDYRYYAENYRRSITFISEALAIFSEAFDDLPHIKSIEVKLVPPGYKYISNHIFFGNPRNFQIELASRAIHSNDIDVSDIVSSISHEMYHVGVALNNYRSNLTSDEEANAYLYSECVSYSLFGKFSPQPVTGSDRELAVVSANKSLSGQILAATTLADLVGIDFAVNSISEGNHLMAACNSLVPNQPFKLQAAG